MHYLYVEIMHAVSVLVAVVGRQTAIVVIVCKVCPFAVSLRRLEIL